jgi:hypothetical protein
MGKTAALMNRKHRHPAVALKTREPLNYMKKES